MDSKEWGLDPFLLEPEIDFLLIADRAEAINGKLYLMGGAWDNIAVQALGQPISFSIAVGINVPWTATNQPHRLRLLVQDADGATLSELSAEFVTGRPPQLQAGTIQRVLFATTVGVRIPGAGRYVVVAYLNDAEARRTRFQVTLAPPHP